MEPTVSVITPTYNRAGMLPDAIESVLAQTYRDWELLIIDDGSTDGTAKILGRLTDPRIRSVAQSHQNVAVARNQGLALAGGRYIAFLDSDDRWLPGKLACQMAYLEAHPELGMIYSRVWNYAVERPEDRRITPAQTSTRFEELLVGPNTVTTSTVLIRRECLLTAGGFDPMLPAAQDWDLWLRVARRFRIGVFDEVVSEHRRHPGNADGDPVRLYLGYGRFYEKLLSLYQDEMSPARREEVRTYVGKFRYLLGTVYLRRGRGREASVLIGGALRENWKLGLAFMHGAAPPPKRVWLLVKPYLALALSAGRSLAPAARAGTRR